MMLFNKQTNRRWIKASKERKDEVERRNEGRDLFWACDLEKLLTGCG